MLSLPSTSPTTHSLPHTVTQATPTQTSNVLDGASASLAVHALQQQQQQTQMPARPGMGTREADGGWAVSWCKDRHWGEIIAATSGVNGIVKVRLPSSHSQCRSRNTRHRLQIIQLSPSRRPLILLVLDPSPTVLGEAPPRSPAAPTDEQPAPFSITSVAWAPSCGRSYHLVATGGRDGHVRIWRIKPPTPVDEAEEEGEEGEREWTAYVGRICAVEYPHLTVFCIQIDRGGLRRS